jgi:hypothetical protein
VLSPLCGGSKTAPPRNFFLLGNVSHFCLAFSCHVDFCVHYWEVFRNTVFSNGFMFSVKELGLLTNLVHWVRVLYVVGSYMYLVL